MSADHNDRKTGNIQGNVKGMKTMRQRIYEVIEVADEDDLRSSHIYDWFMMFAIVASLIPLLFKQERTVFYVIDKVTVCIFIGDYLLRWWTADFKLKKGGLSFVRYPLTAWAIIDLLSILPSLSVVNNAFRAFKMFRLFRTFRAVKTLKVFKAFRYSKNIEIIIDVLKKQKDNLIIVGMLAAGYIFVSALIVFNVEPETFDSFFEAIYWASIVLSTIGFGDIYCQSVAGQFITIISSLMGIAIIAMPAGLLTAGYMEEIHKQSAENDRKDKTKEKETEQNEDIGDQSRIDVDETISL